MVLTICDRTIISIKIYILQNSLISHETHFFLQKLRKLIFRSTFYFVKERERRCVGAARCAAIENFITIRCYGRCVATVIKMGVCT